MIVLDTNILSELMQPTPSVRVRAWLDEQRTDSLWTTSVNVMELRIGVEILPVGRRKDQLRRSLDAVVNRLLIGRILNFDTAAAEVSAEIFARRRSRGHAVEWRDTQIAGIALSLAAGLATRNVRDFDDLGLKLFNPWDAE